MESEHPPLREENSAALTEGRFIRGNDPSSAGVWLSQDQRFVFSTRLREQPGWSIGAGAEQDRELLRRHGLQYEVWPTRREALARLQDAQRLELEGEESQRGKAHG